MGRPGLDEGYSETCLPWDDTTWLTPTVSRYQPCLATTTRSWSWATTMTIRDVLGPTNTNWDRSYESTMSLGRRSSPFSKPRAPDGVAVFPANDEGTNPSPTFTPLSRSRSAAKLDFSH